MKKKVLLFLSIAVISTMLSSCYTYTATIGKGAQGNTIVKQKNHFLIAGLVPVGISDAKAMAGGAADYDLTVTHTFIDGLLQSITFGLYSPTTTIVKK